MDQLEPPFIHHSLDRLGKEQGISPEEFDELRSGIWQLIRWGAESIDWQQTNSDTILEETEKNEEATEPGSNTRERKSKGF